MPTWRGFAVALDDHPAAVGDGVFELRDLVALHQVGVGVVLAVELGELADVAVEGEAGADDVLDGLLVDDGEGAGHGEADRADAGVGVILLVVSGARAEHLALGEQLGVHLKADDGLPFHVERSCRREGVSAA